MIETGSVDHASRNNKNFISFALQFPSKYIYIYAHIASSVSVTHPRKNKNFKVTRWGPERKFSPYSKQTTVGKFVLLYESMTTPRESSLPTFQTARDRSANIIPRTWPPLPFLFFFFSSRNSERRRIPGGEKRVHNIYIYI